MLKIVNRGLSLKIYLEDTAYLIVHVPKTGICWIGPLTFITKYI